MSVLEPFYMLLVIFLMCVMFVGAYKNKKRDDMKTKQIVDKLEKELQDLKNELHYSKQYINSLETVKPVKTQIKPTTNMMNLIKGDVFK